MRVVSERWMTTFRMCWVVFYAGGVREEIVAGSDDAEFEAFVVDRSAALLRTAWLLTGSEVAAQDLVQTALLKTWTRWARVNRKDAPEVYVRRVMLSTLLSWRRRKWFGERPVASFDDAGGGCDETSSVDLRHDVRAALAGLPAGQRAVLVLRYFDDLSEAQTAAVMRCSVGTVKSQNARALSRLRENAALGGLWNGKLAQ
jgi:RNA polymerase sigma-70 factor (sigma-E family)